MEINQGTVQISSLPAVNDVVNDDSPEGLITGSGNVPALWIADSAKLQAATLSGFIKLMVKGQLICLGEMHLRADKASDNKRDKITSTDAMKFTVP
jgi:hypothetical protein